MVHLENQNDLAVQSLATFLYIGTFWLKYAGFRFDSNGSFIDSNSFFFEEFGMLKEGRTKAQHGSHRLYDHALKKIRFVLTSP